MIYGVVNYRHWSGARPVIAVLTRTGIGERKCFIAATPGFRINPSLWEDIYSACCWGAEVEEKIAKAMFPDDYPKRGQKVRPPKVRYLIGPDGRVEDLEQ